MSKFSVLRKSKEFEAYMGSSKTSMEYWRRMRDSAGRYDTLVRPGLYAIIVPSGGGKSTTCRKWGFLDIDEIVGDDAIMRRLILDRRTMIEKGEGSWVAHNKAWYAQVNSVLDKYDFTGTPQVVMVHTEEMAFEIGACPLAALVPDVCLDYSRLRNRGKLEKVLAYDNRVVVNNRTKGVTVYTYYTWQMLDQFIGALTWDIIDLPAPFRGFDVAPQRGWPKGYSPDVPLWILQGKLISIDRISEVERYYRNGAVPEECIAYYMQSLYGIKEMEMYNLGDTKKWVEVCCAISKAGRGQRKSMTHIMTNDFNETYPYESKMASNRRLLGMRRLAENLSLRDNDLIVQVMEHRVGSNQNLVVGIVTWISGVLCDMRPEIYEAMERSGILLVPDKDWIRVGKMFHDLVRSTSRLFGIKLTAPETQKLLYLHMLYGRFSYNVDEEGEIVKRQRELNWTKKAYVDGVWSEEEYDRLELAGIRDAYKRMCDSVPVNRVVDFLEFWEHRRSWAAKGSTVLYEGEKKYVIKIVGDIVAELEMRHNKKSLFEDPDECLKIVAGVIDEVGRNDSKVVPKFESAAKRALLPGNLYHYVVFSYVLWVFENVAAVGDVRLGVDRDNSFKAFDDKLETNLTRFVYDFADFNAQHSARSMARVISTLAEVTSPNDTLKFCLKWLSLSFDRMEIIDSNGKRHKVRSGLYSGWRGTTWINSVLNHAYMFVARVCYQRLYGTEPFVEYEGAGDDVDGVVRSMDGAGKLYQVTLSMGLESNALKQLFGERAEFLRITYEKGYAGASICRALGNFISGNWESEGGSVSEKLGSAIDGIMTLGRRGLNELTVKALYRSVLAHLGRIFDGEEWYPLSPTILHSRMEDGGFGIPDHLGQVWVLDKPAPAPEGWTGYLKLPGCAAAEDWASVVEAEIVKEGFQIGDRDRFVQMLAKDSYDVKGIADRFGAQLDPDTWRKYWTYRGKVKGYLQMSTDRTNHYGLLDFINWLTTEEAPILERLQKLDIIGTFADMLKDRVGRPITKEDWYGELYYTHLAVEAFSTQLWKPVKCPPIVQSKIGRWVKEMICQGMTYYSANKLYKEVCNSYASIYGMEI